MAKKSTAAAKAATTDEPSKRQLQRQMARTRDSLAETVGEIKETVSQEIAAVKKGVSSMLDYREEFQKDPIVWSLGALSAGFALGYTVGYAHKNSKNGKQTQITAFADTMIDQFSSVGEGLLLPALDSKISEMFGFQFSDMLDQVRKTARPSPKKKKRKAAAAKSQEKTPSTRKKSSTGKQSRKRVSPNKKSLKARS